MIVFKMNYCGFSCVATHKNVSLVLFVHDGWDGMENTTNSSSSLIKKNYGFWGAIWRSVRLLLENLDG